MSEQYEQNRFCPNFQECGGIAEPEEELTEGGVLRYYVCQAPSCGMESGYEVIRDDAASTGSCQLGIPESVRRAVSVAPEEKTTFLGTIGRRPE